MHCKASIIIEQQLTNWKLSALEVNKVFDHTGGWGLQSEEFLIKVGKWFANFSESERELALDVFLPLNT